MEGEHTVTFRFDRKYPYQLMDAAVGAILPRHLLGDVAPEDLLRCEFARSPVGNGPFRFVDWDASGRLELEANQDFFDGRPNLDRVVFRVVPDRRLLGELEAGRIDVMEDLPPGEVNRVERSMDGVRVEGCQGRTYAYIGWNSSNPLFESGDVRRALGMAIDRRAIIENLLGGHARPCLGPVHPTLWAFNDELEPLAYDPETARGILAKAGWEDHDGDGWLDRDGKDFEFELETNEDNPLRVEAAGRVEEHLARIGIRVTTKGVEWTTLWNRVINRSYDGAVLIGWSVGFKVDLEPIFHTESVTKYNHTGYSNPEVDNLIRRALAMETIEESRSLWYEAQAKIVDDQPYTFLFTLDKIFGVSERVRGTIPDTRGYYRNLEDWWIPKAKRGQEPQA